MMKSIRFLTVILALVLILSSFCVSAGSLSDLYFNDDFGLDMGGEYKYINSFEDWLYVDFGNGAKILAYKGDAVNLVIPEKINGKTVTGLILHDKDYINEVSDFPHVDNKIETITIPKTIRCIEYDWFAGTPESDLYDPDAFKSGTRFNGLVHEDGTNYLGMYFRCSMPYLKEIIVDKDNKYFSSQDGVLFDKDKTVLIAYPRMKRVNEYIVPESVKIIYDYAFQPSNFPDEVYEKIDENGIHYLPNSFAMFNKLVITKNVKKIGNFTDALCNTLVIDNVVLDKKSVNFYNAKEVIVYKDSLPHKYYKEAIAKTTLNNPPKLTVVANPYAKDDKENTSSKNTTSKKENAKDNSSKTESIQSQETESVISENAESEITTIGATESNTNTDTNTEQKPKKSSNAWVIVIAVAAVILAGGGTAYWIIRRKKKV